jgi:hypothetical protein
MSHLSNLSVPVYLTLPYEHDYYTVERQQQNCRVSMVIAVMHPLYATVTGLQEGKNISD